MYEFIKEWLADFVKRLVKSRLVPLFFIILCLACALVYRLFSLQIINADSYQQEYIEKIKDTIMLPATRGNIYDKNGKLLAYNNLTYNVTLQDVDAYPTHQKKNTAILSVVRLMDKYGEKIYSEIPISVDEEGELYFTTATEASKRRFLRDLYGTANINKMYEKDGTDVYSLPASEVFEYLRKKYYFDKWKDEDGNIMELDAETQLKVLSIRYSLTKSSYTKYKAVTVAENVSEQTVGAVMENSSVIYGLNVQESCERIYNDAKYFAHIIGYTGKASAEDLELLQQEDASYAVGDTVGKAGIESIMELELHGEKGSHSFYKDSQGRILETISKDEAVVGNDIYLSVDAELQIGSYHLLEQMIAGIILNYLVPYDYESTGEDKYPSIPVKAVYFSLINNNVIDINSFSEEDASETEKKMYSIFENRRNTVSETILSELNSENALTNNELSEVYQKYMTYIYSDMLINDLHILDVEKIDTNDEFFLAWKDGEKSLRDFLYYSIIMNWVDTSKLNGAEESSLYSNMDDIYNQLVSTIEHEMLHSDSFHKMIYSELIQDELITGNQVCIALMDQEKVPMDSEQYALLKQGGKEEAFNFIYEKIENLEVTPAQLALDPCSGAVVITNVKTGEVLAISSYPSYDNNKLSGTVDSEYWQTLQNDQSLPLLCRATQTTIAPGSTYKMISAIAGMQEGIIDENSIVECTGVYEKVSPNPTCWIGEPGHGDVSVVGALAQSCNSYFYDIGYELSYKNGSFNEAEGLAYLEKYATMFGLNTTSGVEMSEREPTISYEEPVASAIGQGKNSYSTVQLSRYVTGLASGNLYELSLIDKVCNSNNEVVKDYSPEVISGIELDQRTWDYVRQGMYAVTHHGGGFTGTVSPHFSKCAVEVAGKTGSAQQDKTRSEHAQFVSYAPYDDPEISVTITIPNGYSSGYCAYLACEIYNFVYGEITLDDIMDQPAYSINSSAASGD